MFWSPGPALGVRQGPLIAPWPVGVRASSPVVGVEALRVGFDEAPSPLSACPVPKEVTAEAGEAQVVTANLCISHAVQSCSPFSIVFVLDVVLGCGME